MAAGNASLSEIERNWTYSDMLKFILYTDMEAVRSWKAIPKSQQGQSEIIL